MFFVSYKKAFFWPPCCIISISLKVAELQFFPLEPKVERQWLTTKAIYTKKVCIILWAASLGRFFLQGINRLVADGILCGSMAKYFVHYNDYVISWVA